MEHGGMRAPIGPDDRDENQDAKESIVGRPQRPIVMQGIVPLWNGIDPEKWKRSDGIGNPPTLPERNTLVHVQRLRITTMWSVQSMYSPIILLFASL